MYYKQIIYGTSLIGFSFVFQPLAYMKMKISRKAFFVSYLEELRKTFLMQVVENSGKYS